MALSSELVGVSWGPCDFTFEARWLMAYAAGLGLTDECYFDTTRPGGVVAHPMFPVSPESNIAVSTGSNAVDGDGSPTNFGLTPKEALRVVHAGHDLHLHRPLRQGDSGSVRGEVVGVEAAPPGAVMTFRFDAASAGGDPIWTTWLRSLYRGVGVAGTSHPPAGAPGDVASVETDRPEPIAERTVHVNQLAAHVYTECAKIWHPVHTDLAVARAAGLEKPILHGTATLALGASATMEMVDARPESVRRVGGSFRSMVPVGTDLTVRLFAVRETNRWRTCEFEVYNNRGDPAVRRGFLVVDR